MSTHSIIIDSAHITDKHNGNNTEFVNKLHDADFLSPAKIFQNKHAVHQFENVTPDVSIPGTPALLPKYEDNHSDYSPSLPPTAIHTPPSLSPEHSEDENDKDTSSSNLDATTLSVPASSSSTSLPPSRPTTPSQFVFKKPEYNKHYHHTHFHHHLEKKDSVFKDFKKLFKSSDKKKKEKKITRSNTPSVYSNSDLSFANEFNRDLEGKYGKWGKFYFLIDGSRRDILKIHNLFL
jgi:hypothetical protein